MTYDKKHSLTCNQRHKNRNNKVFLHQSDEQIWRKIIIPCYLEEWEMVPPLPGWQRSSLVPASKAFRESIIWFNNSISRNFSFKYAEISVQEYLSQLCLRWQTIGNLAVRWERVSSVDEGQPCQQWNTVHSLRQWCVSVCADAYNILLSGRNR